VFVSFGLASALQPATSNLDTSFGKGGIVRLEVPSARVEPARMIVQRDGKIIMGGSVTPTNGKATTFIMARYLPDGRPDTGFGKAGLLRETWPALVDFALQTDGKLIVWRNDNVLLRLLGNGKLDTGFGQRGSVRVNVKPGPSTTYAFSRVLLSDVGIVLAGTWRAERSGFAAARFTFRGQPDQRYGNGGFARSSAAFNLGTPVAMLDSFGAVVVGAVAPGIACVSCIPTRFVQFDERGLVADTWEGLETLGAGFAATMTDSGSVIHGRGYHPDNPERFELHGEGYATTPEGLTYRDVTTLPAFANATTLPSGFTLHDLVLLEDRSLLVVGELVVGQSGDFAVLSIRYNGGWKADFGQGGLVRADLGGVDRAMFATMRPNGKLLVVGTSGAGLVLVRFQP
jgi:uncharacterized delta-60 repeat protein